MKALNNLFDAIEERGTISKQAIIDAERESGTSGIITDFIPLGTFTHEPSEVGLDSLRTHLLGMMEAETYSETILKELSEI